VCGSIRVFFQGKKFFCTGSALKLPNGTPLFPRPRGFGGGAPLKFQNDIQCNVPRLAERSQFPPRNNLSFLPPFPPFLFFFFFCGPPPRNTRRLGPRRSAFPNQPVFSPLVSEINRFRPPPPLRPEPPGPRFIPVFFFSWFFLGGRGEGFLSLPRVSPGRTQLKNPPKRAVWAEKIRPHPFPNQRPRPVKLGFAPSFFSKRRFRPRAQIFFFLPPKKMG